jgi:uncharacterized protein YggE
MRSARLWIAAVAAGANRVPRIEYALKDPRSAHLAALSEAAQVARAAAETLSRDMGQCIRRLISAAESAPEPEPQLMRVAQAQSGAHLSSLIRSTTALHACGKKAFHSAATQHRKSAVRSEHPAA